MSYSLVLSVQETSDSKSAGENVPLDSGTMGHKLLEIYYKARAAGFDSNTAIGKAFEYDFDKETCRCGHGHEYHRSYAVVSMPHYRPVVSPPKCESIGCGCIEFIPQPFPLDVVQRKFVKDRVLEYTFAEGTVIPELKATSPEHVEVGFSKKIYEDENRLFILEGRIDLMGEIAGNCPNGWADHKFQMRERDLYLKSIQFRNYSLATELAIGVVNYIRFAKKVEKDKTFKRAIISFSRAEMANWHENLIRIFSKINNVLQPLFEPTGTDEWQWYCEHDTLRNRASCSGKFGYPCDYTTLCENNTNPELIKILESTDYKQRPEWRPW